MFRQLILAIWMTLIVSGTASAQDWKKPVDIRISVGDVLARFSGERGPSVKWGINKLSFYFKDDFGPYVFKPEGELSPGDWSLDIFSPDGKRVLLLQDRFGPYHVVHVDRLQDYLKGKAKPDSVIGATPKGGTASVKSNARWVDDKTVVFTASCCGESKQHTVALK